MQIFHTFKKKMSNRGIRSGLAGEGAQTLVDYCLNGDAQRVMGSSRSNRPSSSSIKAAVEVTGFVMEAIRNKVSRSIGGLASTSRQPTVAAWTTLPSRHISVAAPARAPASTIDPMVVVVGSSVFTLDSKANCEGNSRNYADHSSAYSTACAVLIDCPSSMAVLNSASLSAGRQERRYSSSWRSSSGCHAPMES